MSCVSIVSYSVRVNGKLGIQFTHSRELRQGDLLSPYIFLIYAEGLHVLIKRAEGWEEMKGLAIKKGGTSISHLLFADDNIIFCKAS